MIRRNSFNRSESILENFSLRNDEEVLDDDFDDDVEDDDEDEDDAEDEGRGSCDNDFLSAVIDDIFLDL